MVFLLPTALRGVQRPFRITTNRGVGAQIESHKTRRFSKRKRERADQRIRVRAVDLAVEAGGDVAGRHGGKAEEEEGGGEEPGKAKSAALSGKDIAIGEKNSREGACRALWAR